jgi:hypothetical protein
MSDTEEWGIQVCTALLHLYVKNGQVTMGLQHAGSTHLSPEIRLVLQLAIEINFFTFRKEKGLRI